MFKRAIHFDPDSFLEIASRITTSGEELMFSMRGLKNEQEATIASALLSAKEVEQLIGDLSDWLSTNPGKVDLTEDD